MASQTEMLGNSMASMVEKNGLHIDAGLVNFVEAEVLPGLPVQANNVWAALSVLVQEFGPKTATLLATREKMQAQIDTWHVERKNQPHDAAAYHAFLTEIGYLVPEPTDVAVNPTNVDPEINAVCGPQLVVPSTNARFVLNAANARWGSLYDALYGTDALGSLPKSGPFDAERGAQVVAWAKAHLDKVLPLTNGSWTNVVSMCPAGDNMMITKNGATKLKDPTQFVGYKRDEQNAVCDVFFCVNGLHIVLHIDRNHTIGKTDPAGIADVVLEAATSTIVDLEDSVACVDAEDKIVAYRNWLGLMKGDLEEQVTKGGKTFTRDMHPDRSCLDSKGQTILLKGRSLLLVRNVGLLMTNPAILDADGNEIAEHIMDGLITILISMHDVLKPELPKNSPAGSIYIVKPKMHGPDEVAMTDQMFTTIEQALGLPANTVKMGIMDEERRTSANLSACIGAAPARVAFINTGFLDRTGDEIHTSMEAGPMRRKGEMKSSRWLLAYEDRNVDAGLACGLKGRAQIGKGMWAMPDRMADMMVQKIGHPRAGATTAWVPSPTAATLHATHYHVVNVFNRLSDLAVTADGKQRQGLDALLDIPLLESTLTPDEITAEVENNCQGILGYVVRWIDQGVGCSKVPDIHDVGLMEDRATLRISAQGLANWLHHGIVTEFDAMAALKKMAVVVDRQNEGDAAYTPMAPGYDGIAFQAAADLIFKGRMQPSGYTEPLLHQRRLQYKAS